MCSPKRKEKTKQKNVMDKNTRENIKLEEEENKLFIVFTLHTNKTNHKSFVIWLGRDVRSPYN